VVNKEIKWCPTQGGTFTAYYPEYLCEGEWKQVPTMRKSDGIPVPMRNGGVITAIGLFGYDQAQALAWSYAAWNASEGLDVEVRVQSYEVVYNIKARKIAASKGEE